MQVTTMNDFVKYRSLKIEIARLTRQIPALERQGGTEAADTVKGSSPNFPFVERHYRVIGLINNSAKIEAKKDKLAADVKEEKELRRKLMKFLGTVTDEEIRETLELYYINGLSYRQIPASLGLMGDGAAQMQKVRRYMLRFQIQK